MQHADGFTVFVFWAEGRIDAARERQEERRNRPKVKKEKRKKSVPRNVRVKSKLREARKEYQTDIELSDIDELDEDEKEAARTQAKQKLIRQIREMI